jgi:hypothetical protein
LTDVSHQFGSDLTLAPGGDLSIVTGKAEGLQRVLRRIMTGQGDYIWVPQYGGSVPQRVGSTDTPQAIQAALLTQMLQEQAVSQLPPPDVAAQPFPGGVSIGIQYTDALTGDPATLAFTYTP